MKRAIVYLSALALLLLVPGATAPATVLAATTVIGPTTAEAMNTAHIDGIGNVWDVGRTRLLPDGRWLTLTGDATAEAGQTLPVYDNAAVIWDTTGARRVASAQPGGHFFPRFDDGAEFWPSDFIVVGDRGYVLGQRVKPRPGYLNWDQLGAYGAVMDLPSGGDPRFLRYFPTPSSLLDETAVQWSGAIAYDGTYVYIHGTRQRPEAYNANDGGYTARVSLDRLEVPHRWQFWNGSSWTSGLSLAVPTIPIWTAATNGTSNMYSLHRRPDGQWQVTTKRGGELGTELGRYVGPTPYGPWTWETLLAVCSLDCYMVGAAPDIPTVSGKLLVQWSRTDSTPVWAEVPAT